MKCLTCSNNWKRTKITEYMSLLSICPKCGSRLLLRNDAINSLFKKLYKNTSRK